MLGIGDGLYYAITKRRNSFGTPSVYSYCFYTGIKSDRI
jgi:hypothetical protein